ncbi:MAG: putative toxin-antitoxin system toxin component, PIN family [Anaerolineae bacterium]
MKLVLDTGILISALITKGTPPDLLYQAWRENKFELLTSDAQIAEFLRVSQYPKLKRYLKPIEAQQLVAGLQSQAEVLLSIPEVSYSPDPDDNKIIAIGIVGKTDYIISGDKRHMLSLDTVENIPIIAARKAVEILHLP